MALYFSDCVLTIFLSASWFSVAGVGSWMLGSL
jgi:hypothetical protein